ncbi:hypothetical protein BCR44DRAFT_43919 [Catenaria anguillulae PL171]|uniref:Uncharacterized protein n=1 Tax=Catenaria anguillulae PL171 TaxID=765915 RepID=A0A1Y2HA33_9FUNG|nr:hypothetical protein BCR44DRAFT_43919 [Catenaria anguillulae PL171]
MTLESSHAGLDSVFDDHDACFSSNDFTSDSQDAGAPSSPDELDRMIARLDQVYDLFDQEGLDPDDEVFLLAAMIDDERIADQMRQQSPQHPSATPTPPVTQNVLSSVSASTPHPPAPSKPTRTRLRKEAILEDLNNAADTVMSLIVHTVTSKKYHKALRGGPTWQVVVDVAQALLGADESMRHDIANTINLYLSPHLARVTTITKRLEKTANAPLDLQSALNAKLPLLPTEVPWLELPTHPVNQTRNMTVRDFIVTRFIEQFRLATLHLLLNTAHSMPSIPPIRQAAAQVNIVYSSTLFDTSRAAEVGTAGYVTGYLVSNAWKWTRRNYKHPSSELIRTIVPKLVYLGQAREDVKTSGFATVRNVSVRDKGALLYAKQEIICYVMWLSTAIDVVLNLPGHDRESPFWADQRVRELLESNQHHEAWNRFNHATGFDSHFRGNKGAAERFLKLFRVPVVSIKIGEYVKRLKEAGKSKEGAAAVSVLREELKHLSAK